MGDCGHSHYCSGHTILSQTLDEIDFERGIWSAAMNGERDRVEKLLRGGLSVNCTDSYGYTALHYASRNGHLGICQMLLSKGADSNSQTRAGLVTPLHRAAHRGHLDVVKLLLQHMANPDLRDSDNRNALHKAAEAGQEDTFKYLLSHYPQLADCKDNTDKTPRDFVTENYPQLSESFSLPNDTS